MRIIFICGCLEPGKDGVGDYTRRLAGELIRQGISVGIVSYNDTFIQKELEEYQVSENTSIPCMRIPSIWSNVKRKSCAKLWVDTHKPEWLSLQYVPYAFNKKGLPLGLGQQLKNIGGNTKWHIMFHELWLGLRINDSLKYQFIGYIQRLLVKSMINKINVQLVHTHTQFYLQELTSLNLNPKYLPIFSNIPFKKMERDNNISKSERISLIMFGSIHPNAPIKQFAEEVSLYFKSQTSEHCRLVLVGKSGDEQQKWIKEFESLGIEVIVLGELSAEDISIALQEATVGITTNPFFVVEKSGTVAAMREHGLPVLIVSEDTRPKNNLKPILPNGFWEYRTGNFSKFINQRSNNSEYISLSEITNKFIQILN
jgi:glycosyltransferase involved in cell wall biosynthesis